MAPDSIAVRSTSGSMPSSPCRYGVHSSETSANRGASAASIASDECSPAWSPRQSALLAALVAIPALGGLVDDVPGVLVEQEPPAGREQPRDLLDRGREVVDVVQRAVGDDRVERARVGEVLEAHALEQLAVRRPRVDRQHVVAAPRHRLGQRTAAAADLEHAGGRVGKVDGDEGLEIHLSGSSPFQVPAAPNGRKRANSSSEYHRSARVRRTTSRWSSRP